MTDKENQIADEARHLMSMEQAKKILAEAKTFLAQDLRGAVNMMREALRVCPDYPYLEDEIYLQEDALEKLDKLLDYVVQLLQEGKEYEGYQMLQKLPENYIIQDKDNLIANLSTKMKRVEELVAQAREMAKTDQNQALVLIEEASALVPDYPGLIEQSVR